MLVLEIKRFLGFLVFWFLGSLWFFVVSKILGFLVSWFGSFLVSKLQKSLNIFERYWYSILLNFHFMLFGRYWSHIQYLQDFIKRIVGICRCPSFPKSKNEVSDFLRFIKIIKYKKKTFPYVSYICKSILVYLIHKYRFPGVRKSINHRI